MNNTVIFIRHGETTANKIYTTSTTGKNVVIKEGNPGLTERGNVQARITAEVIKKMCDENKVEPIVYASTFKRTIDCAQYLCDSMEVPMHIKGQLREFTPTTKNVDPVLHDVRFEDFKSRVHEWMAELSEILKKNKKSPIVIYGHSLFISYMISSLNKTKEYMEYFNRDSFEFNIPNCSITVLMKNNDSDKWLTCMTSKFDHLGKNATGTPMPFIL